MVLEQWCWNIQTGRERRREEEGEKKGIWISVSCTMEEVTRMDHRIKYGVKV